MHNKILKSVSFPSSERKQETRNAWAIIQLYSNVEFMTVTQVISYSPGCLQLIIKANHVRQLLYPPLFSGILGNYFYFEMKMTVQRSYCLKLMLAGTSGW
jgi:hypothetical protein